MKINKLKKFERIPVAAIPADTPEERAAFIAELVVIGEKMPSAGVSGESLADILADYKKARQIIVNDVNGNRVAVAGGITKIISGADAPTPTKMDSPTLTKMDSGASTFTESELLLLKQF